MHLKVQVILIADGDIITVVHNGKPEKIRLYGINTPESKQAFGLASKEFHICYGVP